MFRGIASVASCFLLVAGGFSAEEPKLIVQWDNDLFIGSDRDYTNGARIAYSREIEQNPESYNSLQKALLYFSGVQSDGIFRDGRFDSVKDTWFLWGVGVTQLMFTPEDPDAPRTPYGQRPYAGWLGLELSLNVGSADSSNSFTLTAGTTGKNSFAEDAQEWVHETISDSPVFQGWDSQVPGELTINLHFDRKQRFHFLDPTSDWLIQFDGYYEWGAALGNFRTDAYLGSLFRMGYNLPATFIAPRVQLGSYSHELFRKVDASEQRFSLLGFAGVRGYGVLHDITLDGPIFRDFDTGVDSEPWVGEAIFGFGVFFRPLEISVSQTVRSDEFDGQSENLKFGSILLRASIPF